MSYINIYQDITKSKSSVVRASMMTIAALVIVIAASTVWAQSVLPLPQPTVSTVPPNGDVNPYGVAFVPYHVASGLTLQPDDILVSNFNNNLNLQGTGTTIIRVNANGQQSLFYQSPNPVVGLTAALGVVQRGFVFVGNTPTFDGTAATVQAGSLSIIDGNGKLVGSVANTNLINGPWGMAVADNGTNAHIFVSNVLSGTITRFDVSFPAAGGVVINKSVELGLALITGQTQPRSYSVLRGLASILSTISSMWRRPATTQSMHSAALAPQNRASELGRLYIRTMFICTDPSS